MNTISTVVNRFAYDPAETREIRAEKNAIFLVAMTCSAASASAQNWETWKAPQTSS